MKCVEEEGWGGFAIRNRKRDDGKSTRSRYGGAKNAVKNINKLPLNCVKNQTMLD